MDINSRNIPDFQSIFDEFYQKIVRYMTHMVGEAEAEDLTQEIFIKINKAIGKFRGESKLSTWVYKVATNAALDHIHNSDYKQKSTTIPDDSEVLEVIDQNTWTSENVQVPEDQVARKELSACVQEYIQNMPENYRTVIALSEFEDFSNQEIADILGISTGTVKIRLHRGRERLRKDLMANCPSYWINENEFLPDLKDL